MSHCLVQARRAVTFIQGRVWQQKYRQEKRGQAPHLRAEETLLVQPILKLHYWAKSYDAVTLGVGKEVDLANGVI